jgi:electron transfer flavoprotein beta subunit
MRVVVCLKQILDPEIPPREFRIDQKAKKADQGGASLVINPFDENALEMALQLANKSPDVEITAISFGPRSVIDIVRKAMALKVLQGVAVVDDSGTTPDAAAVAGVLAAAINKLESADVVLCGRQAGDWDAGQVGSILAEILGVPCISCARSIERAGDSLQVAHEVEGGVEILEVKPPVVITATNDDKNVLRLATVKDIMAATRKPVLTWSLAGLNMDDEIGRDQATEVEEIFIPATESACRFVDGDTAEEKAARLVEMLKEYRVI